MKNVQVLDEEGKYLENIKGCEEGYFNTAIYSK